MSDSLSDVALRIHRRAAWRLAAVGTFTGVLWAIAANTFQDGAKVSLAGHLVEASGNFAIGIGLALAGFYAVFRWGIPAARGAFLNSVAIVRRNREAPAFRVLILTLSYIPRADELGLVDKAQVRAATATTDAERRRTLDEICDPRGAFSGLRWQQTLRLLRHNFDRLELMHFVLTPEAAPQFVKQFLPLVSALKPTRTRVLPAPHAADHEAGAIDHSDYNEVTAELDRISEMAIAAAVCGPGDICIDITSGTKAYTAAATVKTLNSAAVFSYVETKGSKDEGQVVIYDASVTA